MNIYYLLFLWVCLSLAFSLLTNSIQYIHEEMNLVAYKFYSRYLFKKTSIKALYIYKSGLNYDPQAIYRQIKTQKEVIVPDRYYNNKPYTSVERVLYCLLI